MSEKKVLSKFTILCLAAFMAILDHTQPTGCGSDTPGLGQGPMTSIWWASGKPPAFLGRTPSQIPLPQIPLWQASQDSLWGRGCNQQQYFLTHSKFLVITYHSSYTFSLNLLRVWHFKASRKWDVLLWPKWYLAHTICLGSCLILPANDISAPITEHPFVTPIPKSFSK